MNTYAILFGLIVVFAITFYIMSSYSLYNSCSENDRPVRHEKDRVRCPPKMPNTQNRPTKIVLSENKQSQNISVYEDNTKINNKGFVNELIYRPPNNQSYVDYGKNNITTPSIPLNDVCDTKNLPIGNIHVSFLLDKTNNTNNKDAKLIL